jgi:VWFA-related protein
MIRRVLSLLVLFVAALAGPAAQSSTQSTTPPQRPDPQQTPTFRVRVDSVSVDVIVTDRQGKPVTDLTADEFEIRESGKPQAIEAFKFVAIEDTPLTTAQQRDVLSMSEQIRATADESNRLFVIFLDDYHVRRGNAMRVREQLASFVNQLTPRDLVAVLYPLTPVTAATFSRNHEGTADALLNFEGRKYDYTPRNPFEERYQMYPPEAQERMRNDTVISSLENVCAFLSTLREGRKTVLFVSEGLASTLPAGVNTTGTLMGSTPPGYPQASQSQMFFAQTDLMSRFQHVFTAAGRSNTSIYTLDPRGLASNEFDIADRVSQDMDRAILAEATDSLRTLADQTDGRAIVMRNDAVPALRQMVRDMSAYYLLGYTSSLAPRDGKFHSIEVKVKRRDVEVRARKGYWAYTAEEVERASAPVKPGPAPEVSSALDSLAELAPTARRPFQIWMGAARGTAEKPAVTFSWETAANPDGDAAVDRLVVTATSAGGQEMFTGPVVRDPSAQRPSGQVTFDAIPGPLRVRVVAENAAGRRIDADEVAFDVPDFTGTGPMISTPVVFRGRTARDLQQVRAGTGAVPAATRQFSRTERLLVRFGAYGPAATAPTVTMRLLNRSGEQVAPLPAPAATASGLHEAEVALGSFPPGDYLIEIAAAAGAESTRTLLAIRVTG